MGAILFWRLWAFLSGAPLGVLALWSVLPRAERPAVYLAAGVGGLVVTVVASVIAHRRASREQGGAGHVMRAATAGWVAWPAVLAVRLDIGPGALPFAVVSVAWIAFAFWRHARSDGPAPSAARQLLRLGVEFGLGVAVVLVLGGLWAVGDGGLVEPDARTRAGAWDIDSRIPLASARRCEAQPRALEIVLERGADPRFGRDGNELWFVAPGGSERSQIHRLDLERDRSVCWTCGEPGNNRRPSPHPNGDGLLFDTDRFASWRSPDETEVMAITTRGEGAPDRPARRVTYHEGPDESAFYDPGGRGLVWLRGERGRASIRRATIQTGHGGVLLTNERDLMRAGAGWVWPLAWSPDARAFVAARGNGLGPRRGELLDPATGARRSLGAHVGAGRAAAFSADGALMVLAETATIRAASLLPESLGFAIARLPAMADGARPELTSGTTLRFGDPAGELMPLDLGEATSGWGAPTGVDLSPAGDSIVLGQRRTRGVERILRIALDCH